MTLAKKACKDYRIPLLAVLIFVIMSLVNKNFFTPYNIFTIADSISGYGIVALGFTFILLVGQLDISFGSVIALSACIFMMMLQAEMNFLLALLAAIAVGCACGAVTGFFVATFRLSPFIVSMTMQLAYKGIALTITNQTPVSVPHPVLQAINNIKLFNIFPIVFFFFLLLAVLTLLLALTACGTQSKLMLATTGMEPTLDLTLPDTITLPDKGRDTVYKSYVDKAYSMALAAALLDMDADTMQTQLAGRLSYDAQTGYIQYYTPTEELTRGDLSEFPTDAQLEQTVRERLQKFEPELADTSRIVFSSATYETNVSSKTVDVTPEVNGRMVYGKYHISISFDRDGNVTALTQQYAPLKEGGTKTVRLADAKTVQARLDAHDFSANIAQELTDCTITGFEQAYYMNAGFNAEGDYALYPICVLRGQGTAADGSVQGFEVLVSALAG